ncbi:hypothetical protein AVEN_141392-1 [Araneus ventricosus]|uniref:Uncharacterized protein n=1 Tax=Araneus ventricosus TaxID=182803 RepID=A0A4Y2CYE8_ARAVE|nr:hypothetical protein AVEN_141392-1 [Araneus ventricosus]
MHVAKDNFERNGQLFWEEKLASLKAEIRRREYNHKTREFVVNMRYSCKQERGVNSWNCPGSFSRAAHSISGLGCCEKNNVSAKRTKKRKEDIPSFYCLERHKFYVRSLGPAAHR